LLNSELGDKIKAQGRARYERLLSAKWHRELRERIFRDIANKRTTFLSKKEFALLTSLDIALAQSRGHISVPRMDKAILSLEGLGTADGFFYSYAAHKFRFEWNGEVYHAIGGDINYRYVSMVMSARKFFKPDIGLAVLGHNLRGAFSDLIEGDVAGSDSHMHKINDNRRLSPWLNQGYDLGKKYKNY